jgi:hypothetical protein
MFTACVFSFLMMQKASTSETSVNFWHYAGTTTQTTGIFNRLTGEWIKQTQNGTHSMLQLRQPRHWRRTVIKNLMNKSGVANCLSNFALFLIWVKEERKCVQRWRPGASAFCNCTRQRPSCKYKSPIAKNCALLSNSHKLISDLFR